MRRRNDQRAMLALVTLSAAILSTAALADQAPPRYIVQILGLAENGSAEVLDLNSLGQTAGRGSGESLGSGYRAFIGAPDGTLVGIETVECDFSEASVINDAGQVAGITEVFPPGGGVGTPTPFRYTPGVGTQQLDLLGSNMRVVDMNESGELVGLYYTQDEGGSSTRHAFLYTDTAELIDLGGFGTYATEPLDINDAGQVVGFSWTTDWNRHAFLYQDGTMQDLGTLGGNSSTAYYVSSAGIVVGNAQTPDGTWHAFRYSADRGMEALPTIEGMVSCHAAWITDSGLITGWWNAADGRQRAFYYTEEDGIVDLGLSLGATAWTGPVAANDAGQILLWRMDEETYESYATIYVPGAGCYDLNSLTTIGLDLNISTPSAINQAGQIAAYGFGPTPSGSWGYTSVLLTPVANGDMNCDGTLDYADIDAFVLALSDPAAYAANLPRCERMLADCNCDGSVNYADIDAFVACLSGDCVCD